jgi:hypothetical protein
MNENTEKKDLVGLEIELQTTQTGKQFMVFQHGGKHYKG